MKSRILSLLFAAATATFTTACIDTASLSTPTYTGAPYGAQQRSYPSGHSPYSAPPQNASNTQQRQHAYEVGFRVGQDDFHHSLDKHYPRHPELYNATTRINFSQGYEAGYDQARGANRGNRAGSAYRVHDHSVASSDYGSGFYPYASAPGNLSDSQRKSHAYDVGFRVGQDDFHHKRDKHYVKHPGLYDKVTRESFKKGYEKGYDEARRKAR